MKTTILKPLEDRILIDPDPAPDNESGIKLSDAHKTKPPKGTIVAVGPGKVYEGSGILFKIYLLICKYLNVESDIKSAMPLKPGDRVMYGAYANMEVQDTKSKHKFLCVRLDDVFIQIEENED